MSYIYLIVFVLLSGCQMLFNKMYASKTQRTTASYLMYLFIMGASAALCFFLMAGCDMKGDIYSFGLSFVACLCVILNTVVSLLCMSYVNLPAVTVTQNAGQLVLPALFSALFLHENINMMKLTGIILIMLAFLVTYYGNTRNMERKSVQKNWICIIFFFTCSFGTIIHKLFTLSDSIASNEAYLSMLNVYMVPMIMAAFAYNVKKLNISFREYTKDIPWRNYIYVCAGSVIGCVGLVFSMKAMSMMDMTVYSSLNSSLYLIFITVSSKFILRESVSKYNYAAMILAILSAVITSMA